MTTNPAATPAPVNLSVRARSRVPQAAPAQPVATPEPATSNEPVEIARGDGRAEKIARVREHMQTALEANVAKNRAAAAERAATKKVEEAYDVLRAEGFTGHIDHAFLGKTYLAGDHQGNAPNYVDIELLKTLVTPEVFAKLVDVPQQAVKDFCGDLMLQKVLKTGDKPAPKFGLKEKKA